MPALCDTDLVVHVHDRRDDSVVAQGGAEPLGIEQPVRLRIEIGDLEAFTLELPARVEHSLVLGSQRHDVLAFLLVEVGCPLDRQVVRFGRSGRPDDLLRIGIDQGRDLGPRALHGLFRRPAEGVGT